MPALNLSSAASKLCATGAAAVLLCAACSPDLSAPVVVKAVLTTVPPHEAPHELSVAVHAGAPVLVRASQSDADLRLEIALDGAEYIASSPLKREGFEWALLEPDRDGRATVRIATQPDSQAKGEVRFEAIELPARSRADQSRIEGYRALTSAASSLSAPGDGGAPMAIGSFAHAATAFAKAGMSAEQGFALLALSYSHLSSTSDAEAALQAAERAEMAFARVGDRSMQAQARVLAGNALTELALAIEPGPLRQKQLALAAERFNAAVRTHGELRDEFHRATALNHQGVSYYYARKEREARTSYDAALQAFRGLGESAAIAMVLQNVALLNAEAGDYRSAAAAYDELLGAEMFDRHGYADMLHNSAIAELQLGNVERAIQRHEQSREILAELGDESGEARALHGLAIAFRTLGDPARALPLAQAAYQIRKESGERRFIFPSMQALGAIYREIGDPRRALSLHNEAASYADSDAAKVRIALELALDAQALGDPTRAVAELRAAPLAKLPPASLLRSAAEMELGSLLLRRGEDLQAARSNLERAKNAFARMGAQVLHAESLNRLAELALRAKRAADAGALASEALKIARDIRGGQSTSAVRLRLASLERAALELRVESLMSLAERGAGAALRGQYVERALDELNDARRVVLDEFVRERIRLTSLDDARRAEQRLLIEQIAGKHFRSQQLLHRLDPPTEEYAALQRDLSLLQARLARLSAPTRSTEAVDARPSRPISSLTISYFLAKNGAWVWVERRQEVTAHRLSSRADIRRSVDALNAAVRGSAAGREQAWRAAARELSNLVLTPLGAMSEPRIRIVPDDVLQSAPFALLPTRSGRMLLDEAEIVIGPELDAYGLGDGMDVSEHVLIVADPVFSTADPRVARRRSAQDVGGDAAEPVVEMKLPRLIRARAEADMIARLFSQDRRTVLQGFDASISALQNLERRRYALVHFATHSFIDPDDYRLSALVLSGLDSNGRSTAQWLRTNDILALGLSADLVVLSGCETAGGERVMGQGLAGLSQAFIATGTPAIIATHWPLPDASGARVMARLYAELQKGASPAQALRTAQIAVRADPRTQHPRHWASLMFLSVSEPAERRWALATEKK